DGCGYYAVGGPELRSGMRSHRQRCIDELDRVGVDTDGTRDALECGYGPLGAPAAAAGVVMRLLKLAKRQKRERRTVGARNPARHGRGRTKGCGLQSPLTLRCQ